MSDERDNLPLNDYGATFRLSIDGRHDVHPISPVEACRRAQALVGLVHDRTFFKHRDGWWDRLRAAATPEEKLSCERMINAFGYAFGLHRHEEGHALAERNRAEAVARDEAGAERRAIDRWR